MEFRVRRPRGSELQRAGRFWPLQIVQALSDWGISCDNGDHIPGIADAAFESSVNRTLILHGDEPLGSRS